ncbi:MAG: tetratricopeptide repeat protein [Planctomycetota bacterium]|jgi:tetratricopeptide (TPR) repeat protein
MHRALFPLVFVLSVALPGRLFSQEEPAGPDMRGSLVEDRAARKLTEAGSARYDADEVAKAVEIWQSVVERYPRSRVRFTAHMLLGNHFLERDRSYDLARTHFEAAASDENGDLDQRAEAMLSIGVCYYHAHSYGKCFEVLRDVIAEFPVSPKVNQAYHYIGLAHFQLGHYRRAIDALEKVGTTLSDGDGGVQKLEAGKRLFLKIEDADLAVLGPDDVVEVRCEVASGDVETVRCVALGRNVRIVLGSIPTRLGRPAPNSGQLEIKGDDKVTVTYLDQHTASQTLGQKVLAKVTVVGSAHVEITDGAFSDPLQGVVLGKGVNVQITDADCDRSDDADRLQAAVEVYRLKTDEELEAEAIEAVAGDEKPQPAGAELADDGAPKVDAYKRIDRVDVSLVEAESKPKIAGLAAGTEPDESPPAEAEGGGQPSDAPPANAEPVPAEAAAGERPTDGGSIHSGVFRAVVPLSESEEPVQSDQSLQALPGDVVRVVYLDERHRGEGVREVRCEARCLEGNIGGVRVTRAVISDEELRIQTTLKTAGALTNIGNRYKEFGLKEKANEKYEQALAVCAEILGEARKLGGRVLEQTYVQLWQIYFEMDSLGQAAALCRRLQKEFPQSGFLDQALLQLAEVAHKQGDLNRAIGIYSRLVNMQTSQLRGEAQFGIAACYEQKAEETEGQGADQLRDRAFEEYTKVFEQFPDSGRVGEAVAKMAEYYYQQKDYARAIDTFEMVLSHHPDAKFMDVILFNYGRCLYRMGRKAEARRRFNQLIADFPESSLASDAKKISEALGEGG